MLSQTAEAVGEIELPSRMRILWSRGDEFWTVGPDEMDVPWLIHYRAVNSLEVRP